MKQRLIVTDGVTLGEFTRKAKGYKKFIADPSLDRKFVKIVDEEDGDDRILRVVEDTDAEEDGAEEEYIIVTKEFGLVGKDKGISADIDFFFCDNDIIVLTLKQGALFVRLEDNVLMPSVNYENQANFTIDEIKWLDANWLKSFHKTIGDGTYALFLNDFQFRATVSGQVIGVKDGSSGLSSTGFKPDIEGYVDLSLGAYDVYKAQQQIKQDIKNTRNIVKQVSTTSSLSFGDDEDEDYMDDEDEDEEDDVDFGY